MKNLFCISLMLTSFTASASFFQTDCSNGDSTVKMSDGHVRNHLIVTERIYNNRGQTTVNEIKLDKSKVNIDISEEFTVSELVTGECEEGWYNIDSTVMKRVQITNKDGSKFSKNTVDVSEDRTEVSTMLICKDTVGGEIFCP